MFLFNDTATTEIYTLSLHDALPILEDGAQVGAWSVAVHLCAVSAPVLAAAQTAWSGLLSPQCSGTPVDRTQRDRKSTRLNSSHANISYAVFCLKKKDRKSTRLNSSH